MSRSETANKAVPFREPDFFSPQVAEARRFYLNLQPSRSVKLEVVCGGLEQCQPDYKICRATFPFYSIEYVARGHGRLKLADCTYDLQPGRAFSYGPGVPHEITGEKAAPLVKYFVDFAGTWSGELLRGCGLPAGRVSQVFPPNALSALFDELIQSGLAGKHSLSLCNRLLECIALKLDSSRAPFKEAETQAFLTFQKCRLHIEQNFLRLQTLAQIAHECHAGSSYLCRLFRRYEHQTPYQYLLRLKMTHAAQRLQESGVLVKQIAEEVGYPDPLHFSRVFRSILGLSPAAFRGLR